MAESTWPRRVIPQLPQGSLGPEAPKAGQPMVGHANCRQTAGRQTEVLLVLVFIQRSLCSGRFSSSGREGPQSLEGWPGPLKVLLSQLRGRKNQQAGPPSPMPFLRSMGPLASCSQPGPALSSKTQQTIPTSHKLSFHLFFFLTLQKKSRMAFNPKCSDNICWHLNNEGRDFPGGPG